MQHYFFNIQSSDSPIIKELCGEMERFIVVLLKLETSDVWLCDSLILLRALIGYSERSSMHLSPPLATSILKVVFARNNLNTVSAALDLLEPT